ncbi:MAG: hypothetical protein ABIP03_06310 [Aquihabitans sp.]
MRRSYLIENDRLSGVVIEIDATAEPHALAVLQAGLHEYPEDIRLGFGYDVVPAGFGAWIGDRKVRLRVWPVLADDNGMVDDGDPTNPDADRLEVDFDPVKDRQALVDLVRLGRLFIAAPDGGPVPLVLDVDRDLLAEVVAKVTE